VGGESAEIPRITAPAFCIFLYASRNPDASIVHPGVSALGKKNSTTVFPRKSFKETWSPFWSGKVNSGALSLISMAASLSRSTSRTWLYRRTRYRVISAVFVLGVLLQTTLPPTAPAQVGRGARVSKGPRALGLLELAPNGKAHLIPITILIDGKYYDASAYKAAPVPMALWSETVYEAVRTGVSHGLFTVTGALQRQDAKDANEWMAEGTWQSADSIKAKVAKKPEPSEPRGMNQDEGPPVLRRAGAEKPKSTEPPASPTTPPQTPSAPVASPNATPAAAPPAATTTSASTSSPSATQPEQTHEDQPPEDKDRPALKRGKPKPAPVAKEEPRKTAVASAKTVAPSATTTATSAASNQIQMIPAISDSNGPDPLPYTYNLKPEEEQQLRKKMLAMAAGEVQARAGQLASASVGAAQTVHASSQLGKAALKPVQPNFEDVQLRVFDLADINEPELVLTATDLQYMVTLVARQDVNGELHKSLANITDKQHLDVIPRLELIDAVDVDGDGRGELLFRQVSDAGSAFVVYRVVGDRLYPLFQGTPGR
jgi:hypothetical protein